MTEAAAPDGGSIDIGPVRPATAAGYFLGEGVTWDPLRGEVCWVDILAGTVHRGGLGADGVITVCDALVVPDTAGAVGIARSGAMVVAGRHHLYRCAADGAISRGPRVTTGGRRRLNDGKPDPAGRFVVGTQGGSPNSELLMSVGHDGELRIIDDDLTASNGLAWSPDGRLFYNVDTLSGRVFVRDYNPESGETGSRRTVATVGVYAKPGRGMPDGMTTDAEGCLWIAMWGDGCVLRLDPGGRPLGVIRVPAPHVSSVTFAGPDLATMVITTARQNMRDADLAQYPLSGRLFTVVPGVRGNPPYWWTDSG